MLRDFMLENSCRLPKSPDKKQIWHYLALFFIDSAVKTAVFCNHSFLISDQNRFLVN